MKVFVINHKEIFMDLTNVCFWIEITDKYLRFLQTKNLKCSVPLYFQILSCSCLLQFTRVSVSLQVSVVVKWQLLYLRFCLSAQCAPTLIPFFTHRERKTALEERKKNTLSQSESKSAKGKRNTKLFIFQIKVLKTLLHTNILKFM